MPFPSRFYRTLPDSTPRYTSESAGNRLIPSRILWTPKYYERSAASRRKVPKTLIIADWRLAGLAPHERERFREGIRRLLAEGFPVMLWLDGELPFALTEDNLDKLDAPDILSGTCFTDPDKIKADCQKLLGLSAEHLFVVDSAEMDCVIAGREDKQIPVVGLHCTSRFPDENSWNQRVLEYTTRNQTLIKFSNPYFTPGIYLLQDLLQEQVTDFRIVTDTDIRDTAALIALRVISPVAYQAFGLQTPQCATVTPAAPCNQPDLQYLELIHAQVTPEAFRNLTQSERLKWLSIETPEPCSFLEQEYSWGHFMRLETLRILAPYPTRVTPFLQKSAHMLRHLTLQGAERDPDWPMMANLESLDWRSLGEGAGLGMILACAPFIRQLRIADPYWGSALQMTTIKYTRLTELHLDASGNFYGMPTRYPGRSLSFFLAELPVLKKLSLKDVLWDHDTLPVIESLQELELEFSPVADLHWYTRQLQSVIHILKKVPNLRKLTIKTHKDLPLDFYHTPEITIHNIRVLCLTGSIYEGILRDLARLWPKLQVLDLRGCEDVDKASVLQLALPHWTILFPDKTAQPVTASSMASSSTSPTSIPAPSPRPPVHHAQAMATFKPTDSAQFEFEYQGKHTQLDQGMVVQQLSRYLTLTKQHRAFLPKLHDGICVALATCFLRDPHWQSRLLQIRAWDGEVATLDSDLRNLFNRIFEEVHAAYFDPQGKQESGSFLGDNAADFLAMLDEACMFRNVWHRIAVRPMGSDWFAVYDPNHPDGAVQIRRESLHATISMHLGPLVSVIDPKSAVPLPRLDSPEAFLREGGLFVLAMHTHVFHTHKTLLESQTWSQAALAGMLLRDIAGKPAWYHGLKTPHTRDCTREWINRLVAFPDLHTRFQNSLECLDGYARQECQALLLAGSSAPDSLKAASLISAAPKSKAPYLRAFRTWGETEHGEQTREAFCQRLFSGMFTRQLVTVSCPDSRQALALTLQKHAKDTSRPVFYVRSPEDLMCQADRIARNGDSGEVVPGPGGALHDFLRDHAHSSPIIVVDYDAFETDDLIRFNTLLDPDPTVDGITLPAGTRVIGILDSEKPDAYQGSDFHSRFQSTETCPLPKAVLEEALPEWDLTTADYGPDRPQESVLHLHQAPDWKERLIGRWILDGDVLRYQPGLLKEALARGSRLAVSGGLWESPDFCKFWEEACFHGGVDAEGEWIALPSDLSFEILKGYPWARLGGLIAHVLQGGFAPDPERRILNPGQFPTFFGGQQFAGNQPVFRRGLVSQYAGQVLPVCLTRALSEDEWAALLLECERYGVCLDVQCAPSVSLPAQLDPGAMPAASFSPAVWTPPPLAPVTRIDSTCPDTTIAQITADGSWRVMDISECSADDLLEHVQGRWNKTARRYEFEVLEGALRKACMEGRNVVLRGTFSETLMDHLAPLLLHHSGPGRIILVGEGECPFLPAQKHTVTPAEKAAFLPLGLSSGLYEEPLARLQARSHYLARNPGSDSARTFAGLRTLPEVSKLAPFNPDTSAADAADFRLRRRASVEAVLADSPFLYIAGLSGVGKSTFVRNDLCAGQKPFTDIAEWAQSAQPGRKILFLDEANLESTDWSLFEGLFANPPGIVYQGVYYPLDPENHKVVFAGNPLSYGDERRLASFFERHGRTVIFDPLPLAVVCEDILKPLLPNHPAMAQVFLDVYDFLVAQSTTDVLITPRELEMMALLAQNRMRQEPTSDPDAIARHYAAMIAQPLVPASAMGAFQAKIHPQPLPRAPAPIPDFTITPTRVPTLNLLEDLLDLRTHRQTLGNDTPESMRYGGLGGMVIEGLPGVGKSELAIRLLRARGYHEIHDRNAPFTGHAFIRMPASLSLDAKKALLLKAFHAGIVVIADEINASPMLESFMNHLLMGYGPDHERPTNPGFLLIGTQNPANMGGRLQASTALSRRLITMTLPEYPRAEILQILHEKGVPHDEIALVTDAFLEQVRFARQHGKKPEPGFRDLMDVADDCIRATGAMPTVSSASPSGHGFFAVLPQHQRAASTDGVKPPGPGG